MRLFSWKGVFATAVGLFLSAAVFAQSEDTVIVRTLDESRVVATAKPSSTLQTTLVQAVDHSDIERLGMHELFEAVRSFAGVNIRDYGGIGGI
ncbi:MAG: TonB-dependent receptor, partial [Bacteroidales bacterium]